MAMGIVWFVLLGSLYVFFAVVLYRTSPVLSSLILFIGFVHLFTRGIRPAVSRMLLVRRTRKAVALIRGHLPFSEQAGPSREEGRLRDRPLRRMGGREGVLHRHRAGERFAGIRKTSPLSPGASMT